MESTAAILKKARKWIVKVSLFIKIKLGWLGVPRIVPFTGFSNGSATFISGEVVEDNGIAKPVEGQSKWLNFKIMVRRYFTDEFAGVKVEVTFSDSSKIAITNKYGIFHVEFLHQPDELPEGIWQKAFFRLPEKVHARQKPVTIEGEVMMVRRPPQLGIVSDIDDTIMVSYATTKLMKFRLMLFNNALTRMPFEGVSAFYQSLQKGTADGEFNPLFYLSNSEWNLYDLLYEFIEFNRIPKGPLLLREMEIHVLRFWKMREYNKNHKMDQLRFLLSFFKDMKFILIGDSGQQDPEVYSALIREYPGRVLAVYIRDVGISEKTIRVETISENVLKEYQTELILVKDTEAAAQHAIKKGYIKPQELPQIQLEKQKDAEMKKIPV
jgi:phosphatidate phosphatase APP1